MSYPILLLISLLISPLVVAQGLPQPEVDALIQEMVTEHQFDQQTLQSLFQQVAFQQDIIDAITRPAESKPWHDYRPIFVTESRIRDGVQFWTQHKELLSTIEQQYGVPAQILVAIVGVETRYGRHRGRYRVMDALSTLGFAYPKRSKFFRGQLKEFLLMSKEEGFDPLSLLGSYAGAMGQPQFIPSSFRAYAVDQDGNGQRDLWESEADVLGSVANYFARHQWQSGEPIAVRATVVGNNAADLIEQGYKPSISAAKLAALGVTATGDLDSSKQVALIELALRQGVEHWIAYQNFYVITRYNHSPLYAMSVFQLSEAIRTSMAPNEK